MPSQEEIDHELSSAHAIRVLFDLAAQVLADYPLMWGWHDGHGGALFSMLHEALARHGFHGADPKQDPPPRVASLVRRDGWDCAYCGKDLEPPHYEVDHVVPKKQGGSNRLDNLALACAPCNRTKGGRTPEQWRAET